MGDLRTYGRVAISGGTYYAMYPFAPTLRILNGSTAAVTRVLIESTDATGARWWTVGVSDNIIDASFQALMDSIIYKLMKNRDQATEVRASLTDGVV